MLAREHSRRAAGSHDEVRGRATGKNRSNVVDEVLVGRADKSCGPHDHLDDVHGLPDALVQVYTETAGEVIERQGPAVERLQYQNVFDRGLRFARRGADRQQPPQQRTLQSAANAALRTRSACQGPGPGVLGCDQISGAG